MLVLINDTDWDLVDSKSFFSPFFFSLSAFEKMMRKSCLNVCEERDIITCGSDSLVAIGKRSVCCLFVCF